jgi:hypothetical protein
MVLPSLQFTVYYGVEVRSTQHRRKPYTYATPIPTQNFFVVEYAGKVCICRSFHYISRPFHIGK